MVYRQITHSILIAILNIGNITRAAHQQTESNEHSHLRATIITASEGDITLTAGNIKLPNTDNTGNVGQIQVGSERFMHNLGEQNTFLGVDAGNLLLTGTNNTGIGFNVLTALTTGLNNTAVGTNALLLNTSGSSNTALGFNALASITTNGGCTALGRGALAATTAGQNTAVGFKAMESNTTGGFSTAVGTQALQLNVSGTTNTAMGFQTLALNITGGNNAAFGASALHSSTGDKNTAMGSSALFTNTSGSNNTGLGYFALQAITTGTGNIALGSSAGTKYLSSESSNIVIGNVGTTGDNGTIRIGTQGTAGQTKCFIAGIQGVIIPGPAVGVVSINASGQIGTAVTSSRRYKQDIRDMGNHSNPLYALRPVLFRYKPDIDPEGTLIEGLIAEEVAHVMPDLVIYKDGAPESVMYEKLPLLMLNEIQKMHVIIEQLTEKNTTLEQLLHQLSCEMAALRASHLE